MMPRPLMRWNSCCALLFSIFGALQTSHLLILICFQVGLKVDLDLSVTKGRHVILVEDIVDTGLTLTMLRKHLLEVRR